MARPHALVDSTPQVSRELRKASELPEQRLTRLRMETCQQSFRSSAELAVVRLGSFALTVAVDAIRNCRKTLCDSALMSGTAFE
jgi:hypothetical protein